MLDDINVLRQKDPSDALGVAAKQYEQARFSALVENPENDRREIVNVVLVGMGGSALAAALVKTWLRAELNIPFEIVRNYTLPKYVNHETLVIASSYSGNTEETLQGLETARSAGAQVAIITSGGSLKKQAEADDISYVQLPSDLQPRMAVVYNLRALIAILVHFQLVSPDHFDDIANCSSWLGQQSRLWTSDVSVDKNYAKQLALMAVGKTAVFYGGQVTSPVAYKWKISWNENAKNIAFWNEFPEFNHNEFIGWTSHPIEKPFAIFDLVSHLEDSRILRRFEVSDRLLSGKRPKATIIKLEGDSLLAQLLWGSILADFVSIYVAILNGVDPTPVLLIERLKKELSSDTV